MSNGRSVVGALGERSSGDRPDDLLSQLLSETRRSNRLLENYLKHSTATLDTIVCEKYIQTPGVELGSATFVGTFSGPQTRQFEVVEAVYIFVVDKGATRSVNRLDLQLDDVLYAAPPTGASESLTGFWNGLHQPVASDATRKLTVVLSQPFTSAVTVGAVIMGRAVPTTLGEVLT